MEQTKITLDEARNNGYFDKVTDKLYKRAKATLKKSEYLQYEPTPEEYEEYGIQLDF